MTDFAGFRHGGVVYPLPLQGSGIGGAGASLLRDADPTIFYMLEYFASVLETHIGARLIAEAVDAGTDWLTKAVADVLPLSPEPYLTSNQLKFPLLAINRKNTTFEYMGQRKLSVDTMEVSWVMKPLDPAEAERLSPIFKAAVAVLDSRCEMGFDPAYTPSTPAGTPGELVWASGRAGLARVEVTGVQYGGFTPMTAVDLFFPAIVLTVIVKERADQLPEQLEKFEGADTATDLKQSTPGDTSTIADMATTSSVPAPTLDSVSPNVGSKAGNTPTTLTGSGFIVGRRYRALFANADASNVVATSATTLTCMTPQASAYPTLAADVYVIDQDGAMSNLLSTAFTFTTP